MFACTASWSTIERLPFFPFFRPPPFSASGPKARAGGAPWPGRLGAPGLPGAAGALLLNTGLGPRGPAGGRWMLGGMNGARDGALGATGRGAAGAASPGWPRAGSSVAAAALGSS